MAPQFCSFLRQVINILYAQISQSFAMDHPRELRTHAKSLQFCLIFCHSTDCSPQGSSVHEILQARILEWVAMPSSRRSSQPRDQTQVSYISCTGRQVLYHWTTWESTSICGQGQFSGEECIHEPTVANTYNSQKWGSPAWQTSSEQDINRGYCSYWHLSTDIDSNLQSPARKQQAL